MSSAKTDWRQVQGEYKRLVAEFLADRRPESLTDSERASLFQRADSELQSRFGVSLWDFFAVVSSAQDQSEAGDDLAFRQWREIYTAVEHLALARGLDIWFVDDYDGRAELTAFCDASVGPELLAAIRELRTSGPEDFTVQLLMTNGDGTVEEHSSAHIKAERIK